MSGGLSAFAYSAFSFLLMAAARASGSRCLVYRKPCRDMTIRIVLADDHAAFRRCLKTLLEQQPGLAVGARGRRGGARPSPAIQACGHTLPELLILDVDMRDLSGLRTARLILDRQPTLRILMLSWFDDLPFVNAASAAGSHGYMLKDDPLPELVHAIHEVAAGRTYLSAALRRAQTFWRFNLRILLINAV